MAEIRSTRRVTRYEVSCIPPDHIDADLFTIRVEWRGRDRWAVLKRGYCLGTDGEWDYEPTSSERDEEWLAAHRFDEETALRLADEVAPHMRVRNYTVADALASLEAADA